MNVYGYGSYGKHPKNLREATVRVSGIRHDDIIGLSGDTEPGDSAVPPSTTASRSVWCSDRTSSADT